MRMTNTCGMISIQKGGCPVKKIADAVLVSLMLMASIPGLAEDTLIEKPETVVQTVCEEDAQSSMETGA